MHYYGIIYKIAGNRVWRVVRDMKLDWMWVNNAVMLEYEMGIHGLPFVRICYPNGLNISICNATLWNKTLTVNRKTDYRITIAFPFGQRTLFPYIQNGRITYPPERSRFNFYLKTLYEYLISPGYWNNPYNNPKCLEY